MAIRRRRKDGATSRGKSGRRGHPRGRRSSEEARRVILEAAEQRLLVGGPEAIRLQEIAADVGLSHPTILHHFGSREGLSEALVQHIMRRLQESLLAIVSKAPGRRPFSDRVDHASHIMELTVRTLREQGLARLMAWLVLSGKDLRPQLRGVFSGLSHVMHATRVERRRAEGRSVPPLEDTLFGITMVMLTSVGEVLLGPSARAAVGLEDEGKTRPRFLRWMANASEAYEPSPTPERSPGGRGRS